MKRQPGATVILRLRVTMDQTMLDRIKAVLEAAGIPVIKASAQVKVTLRSREGSNE